MRHFSIGVFFLAPLVCWAGEARVLPPPAVDVVLDPEGGHLLAVEGVAGRLSLGRRIWDGPVESVWPAGSRALVRSAAGWQLLTWNESLTVTGVLDLGPQDWVAPVWNARASAWLACGEGGGYCRVYRAEDGRQIREIRVAGGLRALSLSDVGGTALLGQEDRAVLWRENDDLVPVASGEGLVGAFASGGGRLATINAAGTLAFTDVRSAASRQAEAPPGAVGLVWSGDFLLTVHGSGEIRRWDEQAREVFAGNCGCQPVGAWAVGSGLVRLHDSLKQITHFLDFERGEAAFSLLPAFAPEVR
jgi:hypothetical protein